MVAKGNERKHRMQLVIPENEPIIKMSRTFDFPRDLVWRVYTTGEHMSQWWGPAKYKTTVNKFDFRVGGKWDVVQSLGDEVHPFHGEFLEIVAPEKFTWTFGYADYPAGPETYFFVPEGPNRTRIDSLSVFPSIESRDGMVASGMEEGAIETYDRLEDLLAKMSAEAVRSRP